MDTKAQNLFICFTYLLTYLIGPEFLRLFFFLISNGVKRKGTKRNHVKILIHTKNDAFNFQMAYFFPLCQDCSLSLSSNKLSLPSVIISCEYLI